jgi:hypothetical protein
MAHKKKNRKGGLLAPRKTADFKSERELPTNKVKKGKGHKSGSRQQPKNEQAASSSNQKSQATDRRVGSKKPVQLVAPGTLAKTGPVEPIRKPKVATLSFSEELDKLEQDPKLAALLDRADDGESLSDAENQWLEQRLERISELMDELGITDEEEIDEPQSSDEWDRFDSDDWDDFSDDEQGSRR